MSGWDDAISRGRGYLHYFAVIPGTKYVLGTHSSAPTDSWYTDGGYSYLQGLDPESMSIGCVAHPAEVWPEIDGFDLEFVDKDEIYLSYLKNLESVDSAFVTSTVTDTATTVAVDDSSSLSTTMDLYLGLEAMRGIGALDATTIQVTRARYGSVAREHTADSAAAIPVLPQLAAGPGDLRGRRVLIYAGEVVAGVLSATTLIWRGYVSGWVDPRPHHIRIPVSHVLEGWLGNEGFGEIPSGTLRGLYVPNVDGARWGRLLLEETPTLHEIDVVTDGTTKYYESVDEFLSDVDDAIGAAGVDWELRVGGPGERVILEYTGVATNSTVIGSQENGGVAILLGWGLEWARGDGVDIHQAPELPAEVFVSMRSSMYGVDPRLYLRNGEAAAFAETGVRLHDSSDTEYGFRTVTDISTADDYLELGDRYVSAMVPGHYWPDVVMTRRGEPAPTVRQVWVFDGEISDALKMLWCGRVYADSATLDYTLPERWLPCLACEEGDVDWDGLRSLLRHSCPPVMSRIQMVVLEPTDMEEVVTGWLLALGIYVSIGNDGRVHFLLAGLPSEAEAEGATDLDGSVIHGERCTELEEMYGADSLVNALRIDIPTGFKADGSRMTRPMFIVDSASMQRYGHRGPRSLEALHRKARKIVLGVAWTAVRDCHSFEEDLFLHLRGTLLGMLSRPRAVLRVAVTPTARSFEIGDVTRVTTPFALDLATGKKGITSKLGVVLGWTRDLGYGGTDEIVVMLSDDGFGSISPAALCTSYNSVQKTVTIADATRYKLDTDTTDLDYFEAGDEILFRDWDTTVANWQRGTIVSLTRAATNATITLDADVFGGSFATCVASFAAYASCTSDQQGEGWVWLADDSDGQVEDLRAGWRWGT